MTAGRPVASRGGERSAAPDGTSAAARRGPASAGGARAARPRPSQEQPDDLRFGPRGRDGADARTAPRAGGPRQRQLHQLDGAARDDGDDRRADAVERALHPGQAAEADVERGERQHHHERRQDERRRDQRRAEHPPLAPTRGRSRAAPRAGRARAAPAPVPRRSPASGSSRASLDQIALHVPGERDRPAEAERAEAEEIAQERAQRTGTAARRSAAGVGRRGHPRGRRHCFVSLSAADHRARPGPPPCRCPSSAGTARAAARPSCAGGWRRR